MTGRQVTKPVDLSYKDKFCRRSEGSRGARQEARNQLSGKAADSELGVSRLLLFMDS